MFSKRSKKFKFWVFLSHYGEKLFTSCAKQLSQVRVCPLMRCHREVSWSQRLLCLGWGPWDTFGCSSWWCGNGRHWMDLSSCPSVPLSIRRVSRWSSGKLAWELLGLSTCHRSTSKTGMRWSSKHTRCIRRDHQALRDRQRTVSIEHRLSFRFFRLCKHFQELIKENRIKFVVLLALQPWLNWFILIVEVGHVGNEIFDDVHVWQRVNLHRLVQVCSVDLADASQSVGSTNVHRARSADSLAARTTEGQSWIHFILDLDQGIEHHWSASVEINFVFLHVRFVLWLLWVPSVDFKRLQSLSWVS